MTPLEYCKQKAAQSGSSFTVSFIFLPKIQREAMTALYAFCREVDDVVDECTDFNVAQTKLNWWKTEVLNLYAGTPQHPVTKALQPFVRQFNLAQEHFLEIIDGMEMDLKFNRYEDFKQLQLYCYRVASVVGLLSAQIFGFKNRKTLKYAHDLGMAFQIVDDVLDLTASESVLGKPVASDLREGKATMAVIHALERCTPEEQARIESVLRNRAFNGVSHEQILEILNKYGSIDAAHDRAAQYAESARKALAAFPDSEIKRALLWAPDFVVSREK